MQIFNVLKIKIRDSAGKKAKENKLVINLYTIKKKLIKEILCKIRYVGPKISESYCLPWDIQELDKGITFPGL